MGKSFLTMLFVLSVGLAGSAFAAEHEVKMTFDEIDADKDGVITLSEAEAHAKLHEHMKGSEKESMDKMEYEEWTGTTGH